MVRTGPLPFVLCAHLLLRPDVRGPFVDGISVAQSPQNPATERVSNEVVGGYSAGLLALRFYF